MHDGKKIFIIFVILLISLLFDIGANAITGKPTINKYPAKGNFWVNYTWSPGDNADSYNVSTNGNWKNGSSELFINVTSSPHGRVYIAVASYNATLKELSDFNYDNTQIDNNPIEITNISASYDNLYEGQTLYIDADYIDPDNDTGIFNINAPSGISDFTFNSSTGILDWKTKAGDRGSYDWQISVTDGYENPSPKQFTVNVVPNKPGEPSDLVSHPNESKFWINYTWKAGQNTDSFNISINGEWTNGTNATFKDRLSSPHGWVNISIAGYNSTSQLLSSFISRNTQVPNNRIKLTNVYDWYPLNEGDTLYIDADYTDHDNDTGVFATNATKGEFNKSSGALSWTTGAGDGGIYYWQINVSDRYNSIHSKPFKVIVPLRVSIKFIEPTIIDNKEQWVDAKVGHIGKLIGAHTIFKNTGEDSLILSVIEIYNNSRNEIPLIPLAKGQSFSYRKEFEMDPSGIKDKLFNYTFEIKANGYTSNDLISFSYFNITTISLPVIPISKIKRSSHDAIMVSEGRTTPPVNYTLEANSSVNLTNVSIYDFNPSKSEKPIIYFENITLEANKPQKIVYNYQATAADSSTNNCEEPYKSCIINLAIFSGIIDSTGEEINDSEFVRIPVFIGSDGAGNNKGSSGSRNSGGGGGGMPPGEDFNNIEKREVREMDVFAKMASAYTFKSADPVAAVSFESSVSENGVPVAVEVLKNRSKKIGIDAPGELYKYFNVFVGMSGFSKKVSNGVIVYRVNNSWLKQKNIDPRSIRIYKWDGKWIEKTTEIADNKTNYTYYASLVGNFSSYAITGVKEERNEFIPVTTPANKSLNYTTLSIVKQPQNLNFIIGGVLIIGIVGLMYYTRIKNRK